MVERVKAAKELGLTRRDVEAALADVTPCEGAVAFLREARARWPTILGPDTFYELIDVVSHRMLWPTIFCHSLDFDRFDRLAGYRLRQHDQKPKVVAALKTIGFKVMAAGDSLNDIGMLRDADAPALMRAPTDIRARFDWLPSFHEYRELLAFFEDSVVRLDRRDQHTAALKE